MSFSICIGANVGHHLDTSDAGLQKLHSLEESSWQHTRLLTLSPAHTVGFWPRFGRLRQILKILKDSCNPRLKSVVFDRWFDMSTDSRLMAVAINFFLRLNSGSVRRFQTLSCSVTSPTTTVKPRTNRCAEPDDAISATTSNHENVETSQVDSTTGRKTY